MEEREISKAFRITFLIHFIVHMIFGLSFLIAFDQYIKLIEWPYVDPIDPIVGRLLGATFLGIGGVSLYIYKFPHWAKAEIAIILDLPWILLAIIVMISGQFLLDLPLINWMHTIIMLIFFIAFLYFYFTERKK